jgi:DNA polymerase-3 subunit gamma/tau
MSTLYRDYRPQKFSEVLGQNHIKVALQNEISSGRPASAYLFCGPRAVGKTTLARVVAKAVNCLQRPAGQFEPCNTCASCTSITGGQNLDVVEIDAASNTGVDNVRENIIAFSRLAPSSAKYKVFIIDEVHMLSISAFNALLKIIEEPPSYVIFILCTTEIQKVPGTVISRCERYDFKRISVKEIVKKLSYIASQEKITVDTEILEAVARQSSGHLRDAESLLGQIFSLGDKIITAEQAELVMPHYNINEAVNLLDYLGRKDAAKGVALINTLVDGGINIKVFTGEMVGLLRKVMLGKLSPELSDTLGLDAGESLEKQLAQITANLSWEQVLAFTHRFLEISLDNKTAAIPQLPLELAVTELCLGVARSSRPVPNTPNQSGSNSGRLVNKVRPISQTTAPNSVGPLPSAPNSASPARPRSTANFSAAEILAKWPEFLVKIKKYNHSLSFVLQNCEPQGVVDGNLSLVFKYKFHQDRINDHNIRPLVETTLAEVFGSALTFSSSVADSLPETEAAELSSQPSREALSNSASTSAPISGPGAGLIDDLLKTFGGEVVN